MSPLRTLARADFGAGTATNVILGVRTRGQPYSGLIDDVGRIFADVFDAREHLDIVLLNDSDGAELARVCSPFFDRSVQP